MDNFLTWDVLTSYSSFVAIVFMVVEFTKGIPGINLLPTKYWSFIVSFLLLGITNAVMGTFETVDLVIYALTSITISLGSNGLSNFNKKVLPKSEVTDEKFD